MTFDEPTLVADAGLLGAGHSDGPLGLESLVNQMVRLVGHVGGAHPGRKVLTLVAAILAGASHIDHADRLRAGATGRVLPFRVMAPSTLGTFLRSFTFGHVRQLDAVIAEAIRRAWSVGAGPGNEAMTIDLDSTIIEVHGKQKHGAAFGYTRVLGYHPLLARGRAPARCSMPVSAKAPLSGAPSPSVRSSSPGCDGVEPLVRSPSGPTRGSSAGICWPSSTGSRWPWSITVHQNASVQGAIAAIPEDAWHDITYPDGGAAQVAETIYVTGGGKTKRAERRVRLVVRRTRLTDRMQRQLWPDWRHHAFVTNLELEAVEADRFHRAHATVELAIRDLKEGAGLSTAPGAVLRQRSLAPVRGARPQSDSLDRLPRQHPRRRSADRRLDGALPGPHRSRPPRQPQGRPVLRLPERWPSASSGCHDRIVEPAFLAAHHLNNNPRPAQPQTLQQCADSRRPSRDLGRSRLHSTASRWASSHRHRFRLSVPFP